MAILPKRVGEPPNVVDSLGASDQGDRISLWLRCGFLLHLPQMAVLDQPRHGSHSHGFRRDSRDAHGRSRRGWGAKDHAEGREDQIEAPANPLGVRRSVEVLSFLLRLVHQSGFQKRLQASLGLLRDEPGRLRLQLRRHTAQNGAEFSAEQAHREGGRVRVFVEAVHGMGLYDRERRNRPQSSGQHRAWLQGGPARGGGEGEGREELENHIDENLREHVRDLAAGAVGVRRDKSGREKLRGARRE